MILKIIVNCNGGNNINVSLSADAIWNVTETSLISALSIKDNAKVVIPNGITLTINGKEYTNYTLTVNDNI